MDRTAPHSVEAEQSVIAACLCGAAKQAQYLVSPSDFYSLAHIKIFAAISDLLSRNIPIEIGTVFEHLKENGQAESIGGASYIARLVDSVPSAGSLEYFCGVVKDNATRRAVIEKCTHLLNACHTGPIEQVIEQTKEIHKATSNGKSRRGVDISNVYTSGMMLRAYHQYVSTLKHNRFITGFDEIDRRIRGVGGGEVLFIIARAGAFKTAALQTMLHRYVANSAWGAAFFEVEMPVANITERYLQVFDNATGREIEELYKQNDKEILEGLESRFSYELRNLYTIPTKVGLDDIREYIRLIELEYKIKVGVIGIDYLGLLDHPGKNEYDTISSLARDIKHLAKELNIPVVVLSQTSRKAGDGSSEVTMDMGRGSGAIEEAADFLLGLWKQDDSVLCKILKNRKGPADSVWKLEINKECFSFGTHCEKYEAPKRRGKTL